MNVLKQTTLAATVGFAASTSAVPALRETLEGFARIQIYNNANYPCSVAWTNRSSVGGSDGFYVTGCNPTVIATTDLIQVGM